MMITISFGPPSDRSLEPLPANRIVSRSFIGSSPSSASFCLASALASSSLVMPFFRSAESRASATSNTSTIWLASGANLRRSVPSPA